MKLVDFKLRYVVIPSFLFLFVIWFVPTTSHQAMPDTIEMRSLSPETDGQELQPMIIEEEPISRKTIKWQKWITWIIATGNGLLATAIQIKKLRS